MEGTRVGQRDMCRQVWGGRGRNFRGSQVAELIKMFLNFFCRNELEVFSCLRRFVNM